jgi:hypothetical protein
MLPPVVLRERASAGGAGKGHPARHAQVTAGHCQRKQTKSPVMALPYVRLGTGPVFLGS